VRATQNALLLLEAGVTGPKVDKAIVLGCRAGVEAPLRMPYTSNGHAQVIAVLKLPDVGVTFGGRVARLDEHAYGRPRKMRAQTQRAVTARVNSIVRSSVATRWEGRADRGRIERRRGESDREEHGEGEHRLESHRGCGRTR
jgi:hypothetical protein